MSQVRDTSIEAYNSIRDLPFRQGQVLEGFKTHGQCTNLEMSHLLGIPINQVTPRTNELVKMGLLRSAGKKNCMISGVKSYIWEYVE